MKWLWLLFSLIVSSTLKAQSTLPVYKDALTSQRAKLYNSLLNNTIRKNLFVQLTDSTEDIWEDAFYALELIQHKTPWIDQKISVAVKDIQNRSIHFQRSLLELLYSNYTGMFLRQVQSLLVTTNDPKIFTMSGEYLLREIATTSEKDLLFSIAKKRERENLSGPHVEQFIQNIKNTGKEFITPRFHSLLKKDFLPGNVLMISFQRKNRDYPGLVMVRDTSGNFIKDSSVFFSVPQLARSINNLPGYLTNGNTPEGLFRMDGFDVSRIGMIGPTTNVQLTMPFEFHAKHFYKDSSITDTIGNISMYKKLLPEDLKDHYPLLQSFYAGMAGRTEIIAHGTTVDPSYYEKRPYFPLTPTMGCLCTKEIWSKDNGERLQSDQQLLINAINEAGGADGYVIVINIDDKPAPVTLNDIIPFLKLAGQK
ncbi:MAG: hypothetical protein WKF35_09530 [Ferruginibacter sp.]